MHVHLIHQRGRGPVFQCIVIQQRQLYIAKNVQVSFQSLRYAKSICKINQKHK